jgi:hypothetical protein
MKTLTALATALILVACASNGGMYSSTGNDSPDVSLNLTQVSGFSDTFYFRGPVNVRYQLTINNPTDETIRMRRIDLQTVGRGAYSLRTGATTIEATVPAHGSVTIPLSAWGRAPGGYFRSNEPVTLRGLAYFDSPHGTFLKQFNEFLTQ